MAYTVTTWTDRAVQYAKRYFLRDNGGSDKNLLPPFNEGWTLHENTRMKQGNFVGKLIGSTTENPHITMRTAGNGGSATLLAPSAFTVENTTSNYTLQSTLDGNVLTLTSALTNGLMSEMCFSFNLIEHVLRNYGSSVFGVAVTTPERVAWLEANVTKLVANWHGHGSSPTGNKATFTNWNASTSAWWTGTNHTSGSVQKIANTISGAANVAALIDANGFAHYLAYADASNGTTASTINTDFVELEVYMAAASIPQTDYTLTLNATATNQNSSFLVPVNASTQYTMSITLNANSKVRIDAHDSAQTFISMVRDYSTSFPYTFTAPTNTYYLMLYFSNTSSGVGTYTFTNPQIELGAAATSFAPMKTYDVTQAPGIVTQAGTPLNAANLNAIETGLDAVHDTVDTHVATQTTVHGSTSSATASKLVHRDANARAQFADPSAAQDAATKAYVDAYRPYVSGTYTGDGTTSRNISLSFTPAAVFVTGRNGDIRLSGSMFGGLAVTGSTVYDGTNTAISITTNAFTVAQTGNASTNQNTAVYHYIAFK